MLHTARKTRVENSNNISEGVNMHRKKLRKNIGCIPLVICPCSRLMVGAASWYGRLPRFETAIKWFPYMLNAVSLNGSLVVIHLYMCKGDQRGGCARAWTSTRELFKEHMLRYLHWLNMYGIRAMGWIKRTQLSWILEVYHFRNQAFPLNRDEGMLPVKYRICGIFYAFFLKTTTILCVCIHV